MPAATANGGQMIQAMQQASTGLPDAGAEGLRDIKGYISIIIPTWFVVLFILAVVSVLAYFVYVKFFRQEIIEELSIYERTIKNLTELNLNLDSKQFYLIYSEYMKSYLEERLGIACLEKTADEMADVLINESRIRTNHAMFLSKILQRADLAKFAKQNVSLETKAKDLELSLDIVRTTEKSMVAEETEEKEVKPDHTAELHEQALAEGARV